VGTRGDDLEEGFLLRALAEANKVERPGSGEDADEIDVLRRRLRKGLRRQPGEVRELLRQAESLSRITAAENRMSPHKREELAENLGALLERFGDLVAPPD
jgi:hypothetical protein